MTNTKDLYEFASRGYVRTGRDDIDMIPLEVRTALREAADRIDALEAALRDIEIFASGYNPNDPSEAAIACRHLIKIARGALGGGS